MSAYISYPSYRETYLPWLGQIPAHWEIKRLKWTIEYCQNGVWGDEPNGIDDIACVRVADFDRIKFRVNFPVPTLRALPRAERRNKSLKNGNLLLEKSGGGDLQPVGFVVLYNSDDSAICSNFVARMLVRENHDPNYLCYLHAVLYTGKINTQSIKQNTGIQNLDSNAYLNEKVGLPPLPEQLAIATYLDRQTAKIDAHIAKKQRLLELLAEKSVALISQAVTKGLDPEVKMKDSGVAWMSHVPSHWEMRKNKKIFREIDDRSEKGDEELLTVSHITGVTTRAEKEVNMFMAESMEGYKRCHAGDLAINTMWAWMGALGISPIDGIVSPSYNVYRLIKQNEFLVKYLDYLYRTPQHVMEVRRYSKGVWSSRLRLYPDEFFLMLTPKPPFEEQVKIVEFLDKWISQMNDLAVKVEIAIELLREYRAALISSVVTGKIKV